jgi:hypothetical protein
VGLPNLRGLVWAVHDNDIFPYFELFTGQRLRRFNLNLNSLPQLAALEQLSSWSRLPCLEILDLKFAYFQPTLPTSVPLLQLWCPVLRRLTCQLLLTSDTIRYLSTLDSLKSLDIPNDPEDILRGLNRTPPLQRGFVSLQNLTLSVTRPVPFFKFLRLIQPTSLEVLTIRFRPNSSDVTLRQLFPAIRECCSPSRLRFISISDNMAIPAPTSSMYECLTADAIGPLLHFSNLDSVQISPLFRFYLDDAHLKDLATAWPRLEHLAIRSVIRGEDDRSNIGLGGLAELLSRCPRLVTLEMDLHISSNDLLRWENSWKDLRNERLSSFYYGMSSYECGADEVARFLHSVFPKLPSIIAFPSYRSDGANDWGAVAKHLERLLTTETTI